MKNKCTLLKTILFLAGIGWSIFFSPSVSFAQVGIGIRCADGWWTDCCRCKNCMQVDPPPAYGYCRHCKLLCSACRKELGDLNEAIEKLKKRNNGLKEAYKAFQNDYAHQQESLDSVLASTFGDDTKGMAERMNSNYGKHNLAMANVLSDFSGANLVTKLVTDAISVSQSSAPGEAGTNVGGTLVDILDSDRVMKGLTTELITNASDKMVDDIKKGMLPDQAIRNFNREARFTNIYSKGVKFAGFIDFGIDIYSWATATQQLFDDLSNMKEHATNANVAQNEMNKITEELLKNMALIECIKETQDSLKSGGIGVKRFPLTGPAYAGKLLVGFLVSGISTKYRGYVFQTEAVARGWQIDTVKLNLALLQLKKLNSLLKMLLIQFEKEIFPPLIPWTLNRFQELKRPVLIKLLQRVKPSLQVVIGKETNLKNVASSIDENIKDLVTGYEMDYLSDNSNIPRPFLSDDSANTSNNRWEMRTNQKVKSGYGRLAMHFPAGVDWDIDIYTPEKKFITNRSSNGKQYFHDMAPGMYLIRLNTVPVENILIEPGKETRMKAGILKIMSYGSWSIYDEAKKKFYTSGNKPQKLALPPGTYQLKFEDTYHRITIVNKVTVKFELPVPFLSD